MSVTRYPRPTRTQAPGRSLRSFRNHEPSAPTRRRYHGAWLGARTSQRLLGQRGRTAAAVVVGAYFLVLEAIGGYSAWGRLGVRSRVPSHAESCPSPRRGRPRPRALDVPRGRVDLRRLVCDLPQLRLPPRVRAHDRAAAPPLVSAPSHHPDRHRARAVRNALAWHQLVGASAKPWRTGEMRPLSAQAAAHPSPCWRSSSCSWPPRRTSRARTHPARTAACPRRCANTESGDDLGDFGPGITRERPVRTCDPAAEAPSGITRT